MLTRTCDRCGAVIPDDDTMRGSAYVPTLSRNSFGRLEGEEYLEIKECDLCYKCALSLKGAIKEWVSKKA
jgi:hypothetical protein